MCTLGVDAARTREPKVFRPDCPRREGAGQCSGVRVQVEAEVEERSDLQGLHVVLGRVRCLCSLLLPSSDAMALATLIVRGPDPCGGSTWEASVSGS